MNSLSEEALGRLGEIESGLEGCMLADRIRLGRRLGEVRRARGRRGRRGRDLLRDLERYARQAEASRRTKDRRAALAPRLAYPEELPISARRQEIVQAIGDHNVVIIAGDTGSGKTTQIPKMCLEAGLGRAAKIACTQPRRVAALSLSRRLAEEMEVSWGAEVGCKIRFRDRTSPETLIKMMTDGMLLAEIRGDRDLLEYDTVILDEAHERSLNIDFLLGYLRLLRQRRPDLKIIITSATIDTKRFSEAFDGARIIEVSGRVFPVETRYWPLDELLGDDEDFSYVDGAATAVDKLLAESHSGDILVFMPGERDIREMTDLLQGSRFAGVEAIALFSRLTAAEQHRVFSPGERRRVVVATNIAETSLTIPRIRYVVDTGLARVSRFNASNHTQRLPIEAISRSSADQRKGRCGRLRDGICVRLYAEEDFLSRLEHTQPEIQRADLADVILRMLDQNLGDVHAFPFVDPPAHRAIESGYRLLQELGALDAQRRLTEMGRGMARLATAPTVSRMILQAREEGAVAEVLVIASGISVRDPRERPEDQRAEAERQHRQFIDPRSDFLTLLNIWNAYHERFEELVTQNQMRKFCRQHFLSFTRMREWRDIHAQLSGTLRELGGFGLDDGPRNTDAHYDAVHRCILSGLLSNIATKKEHNLYRAARGREVMLFPGSGLFQKKTPTRTTSKENSPERAPRQDTSGTPAWILAAEIVETSRLFARTNAAIQADWLLELGQHLCRSSYRDPHWSRVAGRVLVHETVRLHGLVVVTGKVAHRRIDAQGATDIFIREALIPNEIDTPHRFAEANRRLADRVETWQTRLRQRLGIDLDEVIFEFYSRLVEDVSSVHDLNRLIRARGGDDFLLMSESDFVADEEGADVDLTAFPDSIVVDGSRVDIDYAYLPGQDNDGVTVKLPYRLMDAVDPEVLEWLVPGLLQDKITCLLRSLPKTLRKPLVPVPTTAAAIAAELKPTQESFLESLEIHLRDRYGLVVRRTDWDLQAVPAYLRMRVDVLGTDGVSLATGRDLSELTRQLERHDTPVETDAWRRASGEWTRDGLTTWDGQPDLPARIEVTAVSGVPVFGYPGLRAGDKAFGVRLFRSRQEAEEETRNGLVTLLELDLKDELAWLRRQLQDFRNLADLCHSLGGAAEMQREAYQHLLTYFLDTDSVHPVTAQSIVVAHEQARKRLDGAADRLIHVVQELLETRRDILSWTRPYRGMADDLGRLLPRHFLLHVSFQRLSHLCRYLKAVLVRAERAGVDATKDANKDAQVRPYQIEVDRLVETAGQGESGPLRRARLQEFRWQVEEFRVSVFAQELGTAHPISPRRLDRKLEEVERS